MEETEKLILELLYERAGKLSYYQLDRKFSNRNKHYLISEISDCLIELSKKGFIIEDENSTHFYNLTDKGILEITK